MALRILDMGLHTATRQGRLMLNVLGSIAQFERELMLERQRKGIPSAKAEVKYKGRVSTAGRHYIAQDRSLYVAAVVGPEWSGMTDG